MLVCVFMYKKHGKDVKELAITLRVEGLSITEIQNHIDASVSTIWHWVKNVPLEQSKIDAIDNKKFKNAPEARKQALINKEERRLSAYYQGRADAKKNSILHAIGCMLYWGEGSKPRRQKGQVCLVNSDPKLLKLFLRFLLEECEVSTDRIGLYIQYFDTCNLEEIKNYWTKELMLPSSCLRKATKKSSKSNKDCNPYGTCSIMVCSTLLLSRIIGSIEEYGQFYRGTDWNIYQ